MPVQLTEEIIRSLFTPQSFERGQQYFHAGAVYNTAYLSRLKTTYSRRPALQADLRRL